MNVFSLFDLKQQREKHEPQNVSWIGTQTETEDRSEKEDGFWLKSGSGDGFAVARTKKSENGGDLAGVKNECFGLKKNQT